MGILSFDLKLKTADGYTKLNPATSVEQVLGLSSGKVFGPYIITLSVNDWAINQQTIAVDDITSNDIPMISKVLTGDVTQMKNQDIAFGLIDPYTGIQSLNGQIQFTTKSLPTVDYQVQVWWMR